MAVYLEGWENLLYLRCASFADKRCATASDSETHFAICCEERPV